MPKRDDELEILRDRILSGRLYFWDGTKDINLWHTNKSEKFQKKVKVNQPFLFVKLERAHSENCGFRLYMIRGEDIGYVLLKRYEVISCIKLLDSGSVLG